MPKITVEDTKSPEAKANWISKCIRTCRREGLDAKQSSGKCYGMWDNAKKK